MQPIHLIDVVLNARPEDADIKSRYGMEPQAWACHMATSPGLAFAFIGDDGRACACGGAMVDPMAPHVAFMWMIGTANFKRAVGAIKRVVGLIAKDPEFTRLHTTVRDDPVAKRFIEWLGFTCETPDGMSAAAVDGGRMFLYSRVRGGENG